MRDEWGVRVVAWCKFCGDEFGRRKKSSKYCSVRCYHSHIGTPEPPVLHSVPGRCRTCLAPTGTYRNRKAKKYGQHKLYCSTACRRRAADQVHWFRHKSGQKGKAAG